MNIATRVVGSITIVDITGEVTLANAPEFLRALMDLVQVKRAPRLIVNMTNLSYIDSAGVACMIEVLKVSRESKLGFSLFGLGLVAREVFELTRVINVFEVYSTEEEAVQGVRLSASGGIV